MNLPTVLFAPDKHTCVFAYVDARERKEYDESHIIVARHAPISVCSKLLYVATASMIDMQELTSSNVCHYVPTRIFGRLQGKTMEG